MRLKVTRIKPTWRTTKINPNKQKNGNTKLNYIVITLLPEPSEINDYFYDYGIQTLVLEHTLVQSNRKSHEYDNLKAD